MELENSLTLDLENILTDSTHLQRAVLTNLYFTRKAMEEEKVELLLFNDGQDLLTMNLQNILEEIEQNNPLSSLVIAGIHCGKDRLMEYGTIVSADYKGRGAKAPQYEEFILKELLPSISEKLGDKTITAVSFAGFSLGGLSAFDIVWNNPSVFSKAGIFSGSFWWRTVDQEDKHYNPSTDRIIHNQVRNGQFIQGLKFFFQCGELDESSDRNHNGVIDSIDDTLDLMRELLHKGWMEGKDMTYLQLKDGKHDISSWKKAMPSFLTWGWGTGV